MCLQARLKNWKGAGCTKVVRQYIVSLGAAALKAAASEEKVSVRSVNWRSAVI